MNIEKYFPKGKYNGEIIDGFKISFHLHLLRWYFMPKFGGNGGQPFVMWLCFTIRFEESYKWRL
jgi:hypothetical protein